MIARVVPALKLPAQMEYFDYQIPPGLAVAPGDFVQVSFHGKKTLGIVLETKTKPDSSRYQLQLIANVVRGIHFSPELLDVLRVTALSIRSNLPFLIHALTPERPKRAKDL